VIPGASDRPNYAPGKYMSKEHKDISVSTLTALIQGLASSKVELRKLSAAHRKRAGRPDADSALDNLASQLADIDSTHLENVQNSLDFSAACDLGSALLVVQRISCFLSEQNIRSEALDRLGLALASTFAGEGPASMFLISPLRDGGRPQDSDLIQGAKGFLAGLMHAKQLSGMSRKDAAIWVAKNIPRTLSSRISRKPITPRAVEEWRVRYGKKSARNYGCTNYCTALKIYGSTEHPLSIQRFREALNKHIGPLPAL
jgi:hypothetical protein